MAIRKVGGIYFWNVGRVGGSFHVSKRKTVKQADRAGLDWFGMAACLVLTVTAFGAL